jgi:hypothetical protein
VRPAEAGRGASSTQGLVAVLAAVARRGDTREAAAEHDHVVVDAGGVLAVLLRFARQRAARRGADGHGPRAGTGAGA